MDIRPCTAADVALLESAMPSGLDRRHEHRFRRQRDGLGTYLVAWDDGVPVGKGETGCRYLDPYSYSLPDGERVEVADRARFLVTGLPA